MANALLVVAVYLELLEELEVIIIDDGNGLLVAVDVMLVDKLEVGAVMGLVVGRCAQHNQRCGGRRAEGTSTYRRRCEASLLNVLGVVGYMLVVVVLEELLVVV